MHHTPAILPHVPKDDDLLFSAPSNASLNFSTLALWLTARLGIAPRTTLTCSRVCFDTFDQDGKRDSEEISASKVLNNLS